MIVYDLGCCGWGEETSIEKLVERFRPGVLKGFDPQVRPMVFELDGSVIRLSGRAAWTHDRGVYSSGEASRMQVGEERAPLRFVPSFDLAAALLEEPEPVVVKMDVEGGEYVLVPHLIETGAISNVSLLLVEWHGDPLEGAEWEPWH